MANIIQQKHSSTTGTVPTAADLALGEFAVQAADGKVFIKTTADKIVNLLDYTFADGGEITLSGIQAPANLTATSYDQAVELSWAAPVSDTYPITGYVVQYSTEPQSNSWTTYSAGVRTVVPVYNLTADVNYTFRVAALNSSGQSPWSSLISATPFSLMRGGFGTPSPGYGGLIKQDGDYFVHKFLQNGTLNNPGNNLSYLIVGGGGGGGGGGGAGGGGGGQVILGSLPNDGAGQYVFFASTSYAVTIGSGGIPGRDGVYAAAGTNSSLEFNVRGGGIVPLVARGGGGGGQYDNRPGGDGASGGGGTNSSTGSLGGAAITPGVTGYNGQAGSLNGGGGGGGAGGPGNTNIGGVGITTAITGAAVTYGTGGNGSNAALGATSGRSGSGNGGAGGGNAQQGGYGGSGVVIIRYTPIIAIY